jgi:hypothetical protein
MTAAYLFLEDTGQNKNHKAVLLGLRDFVTCNNTYMHIGPIILLCHTPTVLQVVVKHPVSRRVHISRSLFASLGVGETNSFLFLQRT